MPDFPVAHLVDWLRACSRVAVITGAGVSTASGIPDYRDADGQWKRAQPVTLQQFVGDAAVRQRYWARSFAGWPHFSRARPNAAHVALAELERRGRVHGVVTQNVDRLHQRAGSRQVVDLHGRLDVVVCLDCATRYRREWLQRRLAGMNTGWDEQAARIAPDGDADIEDADFARFRIPDCPRCGGMLKPDVVFYGESVPAVRRDQATSMVNAADGILIVGSSLMVWSSFRLVRAAAARGASVAAINQGRTRADDLLAVKCMGDGGDILRQVLDDLDAK
ncbi:MAG TPA: NAD-dependent protein deacetylase [Rhodanobacteraceae bacterium]|nr:NAD-dependent protein deacetylase [Rhodanobacteraceae bacterium]